MAQVLIPALRRQAGRSEFEMGQVFRSSSRTKNQKRRENGKVRERQTVASAINSSTLGVEAGGFLSFLRVA